MTGNDVLVCRIVNAGTKGIAVKIEIIDLVGDVEHETEVSVPAGEVAFLSDINQALSCRFSGPFSKSAVRARIDIFSNDRTVVAVAE